MCYCYSLCGCKELDMIKQLKHTHTHTHTHSSLIYFALTASSYSKMLVNVFSVERQTQQVDRAGTSSAQQSTAGPLYEPSCSFYPEPWPVCCLDRCGHCPMFWKMTEILQCSEAPKGGTTSLLRKVENSWELLCVKDFKHHI